MLFELFVMIRRSNKNVYKKKKCNIINAVPNLTFFVSEIILKVKRLMEKVANV